MDKKDTLYMRIATELEREISHNLYPGAALDSEVKLADRFQVNRHTIRKSVDNLVMKGLVERKRGVGLFVTKSKSISYALNGNSKVTDNLRKLGISGEISIRKRYLEVATMHSANWLKCSPGDPLLIVETSRYADGILFGIIYHRFVYADYALIHHQYEAGSLHRFLKENYEIELKRVKTTTTAVLADSEKAEALRIPEGRPLLKVRSLNANKTDGLPVEYSTAYMRADMVELTTTY